MSNRIFLGLGSNLGDPQKNIYKALDLLRERSKYAAAQLSPLYKTPPLGDIEQPDFVNAVVEIYTEIEPMDLLKLCKSIENDMGREKTQRWGPRLIDIDILLYANQVIRQENLSIPHIGIAQRSFVLYPLSDLADDLEVPALGRVSELKSALGKVDISLL